MPFARPFFRGLYSKSRRTLSLSLSHSRSHCRRNPRIKQIDDSWGQPLNVEYMRASLLILYVYVYQKEDFFAHTQSTKAARYRKHSIRYDFLPLFLSPESSNVCVCVYVCVLAIFSRKKAVTPYNPPNLCLLLLESLVIYYIGVTPFFNKLCTKRTLSYMCLCVYTDILFF